MRIYGHRQLKTLSGPQTRPTTAMVREAVFNIWQGQIAGCRWLDLCAGIGSMGAEALARGAAQVIGIENARPAWNIILQNWEAIAREDQRFQLLRGPVEKQITRLRGQQFDHIYFDPPYRADFYNQIITAIAQEHLLDPQGQLAVEHGPKLWQPQDFDGLIQLRTKKYGNTAVTFYQPAPQP